MALDLTKPSLVYWYHTKDLKSSSLQTRLYLMCLYIIDIREEIDRKSHALNTRMHVPQFTNLCSPIKNLSHVTKNVGFM